MGEALRSAAVDRVGSWQAAPSGFVDMELPDMANLTREDTGVEGVICISTVEGRHGPRVRWFSDRPQRGAPCLSVTVVADPLAHNLGLPARIADGAADPVRAWVAAIQAALTDFWDDGHAWSRRGVTAFIDRLAKLP